MEMKEIEGILAEEKLPLPEAAGKDIEECINKRVIRKLA